MTAAFACATLGIVPTVRHADYIGAWLEVLREDDRAIVRAASAASRAADYLLAFRSGTANTDDAGSAAAAMSRTVTPASPTTAPAQHRGDYADYIARALATEGGHPKLGRGGATLYFEQARLSGCLEEQIKAEAIAAGLPVIDSRELAFEAAYDLAVRGPIIAVGEPPSPPPYHALSFAPLAVVAKAYRAAGAEVFNVPPSGAVTQERERAAPSFVTGRRSREWLPAGPSRRTVMASANPRVALSASRDIPFNKLLLSSCNVRRIKAGVSIQELADDIARRTLLQSLTVRPVLDAAGQETGMYEIPAGGRRYRALELLIRQKRLAKTAPIPCVIRLDGIAEEDSLAENVQRAPLHPLDQFRAFLALRERGQSEEEIAAAFFVSVSVVRQRLRLASVSPRLLDAYADDAMTLDQLMASPCRGIMRARSRCGSGCNPPTPRRPS